jgi:hypothetical protein
VGYLGRINSYALHFTIRLLPQVKINSDL